MSKPRNKICTSVLIHHELLARIKELEKEGGVSYTRLMSAAMTGYLDILSDKQRKACMRKVVELES